MDGERGSEQEFQALLKFLYMAPVGVVQMTLDGDITLINPMAANLLMPLQADGTLANLFSAVEHSLPEIRKLVLDHEASSGMLCKGLRFSPLFRARRHAENKTFELTLLKIDPDTLMAVLADVTDLVLREEQIRLGSAWYNALLNDQFRHGTVGLDAQGVILRWSHAMEDVTGFCATQAIGQPCSMLFQDGTTFARRLPDLLHEVTVGGWTLQNDWGVRACGKSYWASYIIAAPEPTFAPVSGGIGAAATPSSYVLLLRDIDLHADVSAKMIHATSCDDLTGLFNRRAFFDKAEAEFKRWQRFPRPLCLLAIDADHFKRINDRFGHDVGDCVLKAVATAIKESVRQIDITARIGGEEFAVLLPYTDLPDASDLAERIRQRVAALVVDAAGNDVTLTVSVGVARMAPELGGIREFMKTADGALYSAKHAGRNQVRVASGSTCASGQLAG